MSLSEITLGTDTLVAILVTALISGIVPTILLLIKIGNARAARVADRLEDLSRRTTEAAQRSATNRKNVEELWEERDELKDAMTTLCASLERHSQSMEAVEKPENSS